MYEIPVFKTKVKYSGEFDAGKVYSFIKGLFEAKGFKVSEEKSSMEEVPGKGKSFNLELKAEKKLDSYTKAVFSVKIEISDYKEQEAFEGGHRVVKNVGDLEISISSKLQLDYENKWEAGILSYFRPTFERVWYKEKLDNWKKSIYLETDNVKNELRKFLVGE